VPSPPPRAPFGHQLLEGKTVIVTAAAGTGIGYAVAKRCLEEGARVMISDLHERRLAEARESLAAVHGKPPAALLCDVTDEGQVQGLIAGAIRELGHVDVLVNNAGLGGFAPVVEMRDEQWFKVLDVTLNSVFRMTRAVLPHMIERRTGAIVNNASVLGWRAQKGQSHYAAAKAGVMAFTRCVALEAAEAGVRVNAVSPSLAMHEFLSKVTPDGLLEELVTREAFGRAAEPWEVANVMVFLASDYASYMTGEVVSVSGQHP
jgi:3-oxoacyl-[acyl-carrier protein] reductase